MIEQVADDIWIAEGGNVDFYGFAYPTRSVIVRLRSGGLWVWSPIKLSEALKQQLQALGKPAHLVSPNKIHHLFLSEWSAVYPEAALWGPRSTIEKRKDLHFQPALEDRPPEPWRDEIDQAWFRGSIFMDEIVFFHRNSRTAILADLSENFSEAFLSANWKGWQQRIARWWSITEGRGYAPLEWRLSFVNRQPLRAARDKVLHWKPERVIMAHGEWQRRDGTAYLENCFAWIG